jgi:hypothetical protein
MVSFRKKFQRSTPKIVCQRFLVQVGYLSYFWEKIKARVNTAHVANTVFRATVTIAQITMTILSIYSPPFKKRLSSCQTEVAFLFYKADVSSK